MYTVVMVMAALVLCASQGDEGHDPQRQAIISRIERVLGLRYPYEVLADMPSQRKESEVVPESLWSRLMDGSVIVENWRSDLKGWLCDSLKVIDFVFEGGARYVESASTATSPPRYVYLGARNIESAAARRVTIGSEEELAFTDVLELFAQDQLPASMADSLAGMPFFLREPWTTEMRRIWSRLSESQQDAAMLLPIAHFLRAQAKELGGDTGGPD